MLVKQTAADRFIQTPYQFCYMGTNGHPSGLPHAGINVALMPFVYLMLVPASLLLVLEITLGEFAIHYHMA